MTHDQSHLTNSFTGRARRKQTSWLVRAGDVAAKWCITIGGIGTIAAVSLVFLFLFSVVVPLFFTARVADEATRRWDVTPRLTMGLDEFRTTVWELRRDGQLIVARIDTGEILAQRPLIEGVVPTAVATTLGTSEIAVAGADGSLRIGSLAFVVQFPPPESVPADVVRQLATARYATWNGGVLEKTPQGQLRQLVLESKFSPPVSIADGPIAHVDLLTLGGGDGIGAKEFFVAFATENGAAKFAKLAEENNALTGESSFQVAAFELPPKRVDAAKLLRVLIAGRGDNVYLAWEDGRLQRFDVRDTDKIAQVEEVELLAKSGTNGAVGRPAITGGSSAKTITACGFVLGRETLICGDSRGGLHAWFRVRSDQAKGTDGQSLTKVHDLTTGTVAVTSFRPSERGRSIAVGYADGSLRVFHVTTESRVLEQRLPGASPVLDVVIAPKEDGLLAVTQDKLWSATFDQRHPEGSLSAMFRPVWYEGYDRPMHIWQSSFATSAPEMKLGLLPLVHGTLKATFYAMLFAAPLALLTAIFTSEFLHPQARAICKPTIEMMASLPSVVLGFLAALVFATVVEAYVPEVLSMLFCVPFTFVLAAHLWQALPPTWTLRMQPWRVCFLPIPLLAGIGLSFLVGPLVERRFFAGDIMRWLDGQAGDGIGAWLFLWLPLSILMVAAALILFVNPWLRNRAEKCSRRQFVLINLTKFLVASCCAFAIAYCFAWFLNAVGWDPRGSFVSTYVQRNALVVGVVMGFAIIPIIFTIADDALNTVPQHLRSASLGCGATPWQTAIRIVVPTAMSGLFSALMIGLGRAVGETMIVLMAGGNTPTMSWNVFEGFRTLSANIATEMPEAVKDSTHYRTLVFAGLTLFVMTFCLNTVAEMVRIRFRKRAIQL